MTKAPSWLDKIESFHNWLADRQATWFPFLFLKPRPSQKIREGRRWAMTLCFSIYTVVIWSLGRMLFGIPWNLPWVENKFLISLLSFYLWFRVVSTFFWNRRAGRLTETIPTKHKTAPTTT